MNTSAGATNSAICVDEPIAISSVISTLFRTAKSTAEECSAALPMIGITISPTKSSESPSVSSAGSSEPTRNSDISATNAVATRSITIARRRDHVGASSSDGVRNRCSCVISVKTSAATYRTISTSCHRPAHDLPLEERLPAAQREQRRHQEPGDGEHERGRVHRCRPRVVLLFLVDQPAEEEREPQHEQQVPQDRAGE